MLKRAFLTGAAILLLGAIAAAQDGGRFDVSAAWGGVFGKGERNTIGNVTVSPTNSSLLLGSFRFHFNHMHAIEGNYGRTIDSQLFIIAPDQYRVQTTIVEYSGAYVFSPFHFRKLQPFLFAGGGALRFSPGTTYIDGYESSFGAVRQTSIAFLYGGGADYPVWRGFGLRLQYRGLIYKEPTFRVPQFFTGVNGHAPEASIGVRFRF
jgi:opacity protein-like surface antigen